MPCGPFCASRSVRSAAVTSSRSLHAPILRTMSDTQTVTDAGVRPTVALDLAAPVVVARVERTLIAVPSAWATQMVLCPRITPVPWSVDGVRGVAVHGDRTLTVVDARLRLGLTPRADEVASLVQLLHDREADHVRWLDTLTNSIRDQQPFPLARDPNMCAFGKWFNAFVPPTLTLKHQLSKFRVPHERIHALAAEAEALSADKGKEAALALLQSHQHSTLRHVRALFEETRAVVANDLREIVIIHDSGTALVGLIVDEIASVERLRADTVQPVTALFGTTDHGLIHSTARTQRDEVLTIPDMAALIGRVNALATTS